MYICGEERRPSEGKAGVEKVGYRKKIHETWKQRGYCGRGDWEATKLVQRKKEKQSTQNYFGCIGVLSQGLDYAQ